jgi:hypothetical protein
MKVLFLDAVLDIYLIPQDYPINTDTLTLELRREQTDVIISPAVTFTTGSEQLKVTITDQPDDFKTKNKYEFELKNGASTIFRGKIIILAQGTDVQNYEYNSQPNKRYDYK